MASAPPLTSRANNVVVLRALSGIGDHLCILPALRALRAGLCDAHIAVITVRGGDEVLSRFPQYVDELIPFAGFPGIPEQPFTAADLPRFYAAMVDRGFDLAIQMQGDGTVANSLVAMLGAKTCAGYFLPGQYRPDEHSFMPYPGHLPEIRRHISLMEFLGYPSQGEHLEFPVQESDRAELEMILAVASPGSREPPAGGDYVCIHPGAMADARRWSPAGFAEVADTLAESGYTVRFTGRAFETGLVTHIRGLMRRPAIDLSGRTSTGALAALIEGASLVVCNDTGVSHLAAALRVPSVVVFAGTAATGSDPGRWAPLDRDLHLVVARETPGPVPTSRVLEALREQMRRREAGRTHAKRGRRDARATRVLVAAAADIPETTVEKLLRTIGETHPGADIEVLTEPALWERPAHEQWEWIDQLRSEGFGEVIIMGDGTRSPYPLAYACYLAGIPSRCGVTAEFGGKLLTGRVLPVGAGLFPAPHELIEKDRDKEC